MKRKWLQKGFNKVWSREREEKEQDKADVTASQTNQDKRLHIERYAKLNTKFSPLGKNLISTFCSFFFWSFPFLDALLVCATPIHSGAFSVNCEHHYF